MSKLQNNFTTPEQSKGLLELGLSADSADMHYHQECVRMKYGKEEFEYFLRYGKPDINTYSTDIPCWSVGRLMEIVDMCSVKQNYAGKFEFEMNKSYIQNLIYLIIGMLHTKDLDFSKLEE
jgi:hypothetical protein